MTTTSRGVAGVDPILLVQLLGGGSFLGELYEAVRMTASEVVETGHPGAVSCSIKISRQENGDAHMLNLLSAIKRSPPVKGDRAMWLFSFEGDLHRGDPRQLQLEFRAVAGADPELRQTERPDQAVREIG